MKDDKVFADAADLELQIDMLEEFDANSDDKYNTQMICWLKELQQRRTIQPGNSAQPVTVPDELIHHDKDPEVTKAYKIGFNACLAVVKSATVTVPAGWIPVSERMPDKLIPVMVMYEDGDMWSAIWSGHFWDDGCAIPDPHSITHWRDMPDAPKGV
ncbi:DUF551 domain-containing protein [Phytobacter diazotrophicus]|uniref:DUF551 domain-containing protein n=1 Tax=Phytobacter diazotrophicus TaxID=395631 RepID=UPI003076697D